MAGTSSTTPESTSATHMSMKLTVFVILTLVAVLVLGGTAAILMYRKRVLAVASGASGVVSCSEVEKGNTAGAAKGCKTITEVLAWCFRRFLRWRHRVLYESDSIPELALLPWYRPKESIWKKILNTLLWKKRVVSKIQPDPPTIVSITRSIEERAKAREPAALTSTTTAVKSSPPQPSFWIPEIVVQCWDDPVDPALSSPNLTPSCSTASSASTASSTSGCLMPASQSSSALTFGLDPSMASPATLYFPGFPSTSVSSFDHLQVPSPSWGQWGEDGGVVEVPAHVSNVSDERFFLAPHPRALIKGKTVGRGTSASFAITTADTKSTRIEVDVTHLSLEVSAGVITADGPCPSVTGTKSEVTDANRRTTDYGRNPPHPASEESESDMPTLPIRLAVSSSTTSSLVDLLLEALAADTDYATAYSSLSSSSSSSSRDSTSSTMFTARSCTASDGDVDTDAQTDSHGSFLNLEDESEEDFLDAYLSLYIRDNEDPNPTSNSGSGSDYSEFDEVNL